MANGTIAFDTLTTSDSKGTANLSANVEVYRYNLYFTWCM